MNANAAQPYRKYDKFFIFLYYTIKLIKCYDKVITEKNMDQQEPIARTKKWYQKGWFIALVIVIVLFAVLAVIGNIQKKKNQEEAARLQQKIQLQQAKTDCLLEAAQNSKNEYYDEATDGPAIAACEAKYGN